jgi:hypothetical protein
MSDIVGRLRNWRTVHLTQLRYVMESAADEIERLRLSARADFPEPDNAAREDNLLTAAERLVLRQVCDEYADEDDVRCNEIAHVIDRLLSRAGKNGETAGEEAAKCTVKNEKLLERDRTAGKSARVAWVAFATDGSESRYVSASQEQAKSIADDYNWCIAPLFAGLNDEEREAIENCIYASVRIGDDWSDKQAATLRSLLERLGGGR